MIQLNSEYMYNIISNTTLQDKGFQIHPLSRRKRIFKSKVWVIHVFAGILKTWEYQNKEMYREQKNFHTCENNTR